MLCSARQDRLTAVDERVCAAVRAGGVSPDVGSWTALVWAARFGHGRAVELLIGAKANVEAKDTGGYGHGPKSVLW